MVRDGSSSFSINGVDRTRTHSQFISVQPHGQERNTESQGVVRGRDNRQRSALVRSPWAILARTAWSTVQSAVRVESLVR
jgi:hypothetical protein